MTATDATTPLTPDLCVIGAGAAGLSVASIAASLGASVVLIESNRMGGECLNVGCVPSKALIAAARWAHERGRADGDGAAIDFSRVQQHVASVIAAIAPMDSPARYGAMGVQVIQAEAHFTDAVTVSAGGRVIKARRFVLATGSRPAIPPIPGLDQVPYLTSETVFELTERPRHLMVIGGGAVGVELAQAYRRLGAAVTVIEAGPRIVAQEDPEMVSVIERALCREGVTLRKGAAIERIELLSSGNIALRLWNGDIVEGSHLLVAAGREPRIEGLEPAGIKADASGILVNRRLKTTNRKVYAIGDCAGAIATGGRFTHVANHHAGLVIRNALFRLPARLGKTPVPRVVHTAPELATVGLSEAEARAKHGRMRILRWPLSNNDRARAEGATEGHVKAIVTRRGKILGCSIVSAQAGELIMPWVLAMARGLKVSDLAGLVYPYPTFSEATKGAAVEFLKPTAQKPWLRWLIGLVRHLG
ncbi:dihydrolipoyl dehydrogenase family protein [Microvirga alba]|uniref:dihydrolipoyl dehydrogenase family protein n=1 Tax=Microvirga alba TaxID=2791025 RepID=UPI002D21EAEB|nr:FAD-dependent oxidoreductase [Microvirga alba]